ncbi:MAG TPA: diguanylate cyclase [Candidatus Obscuribacterales bacterium]
MQAVDAHLVLVDDEPEVRALNVWWIKDLGWKKIQGVESVADLMDYLGASLRHGKPVDLILMDIMMPGVNGIEGCQIVRSHQAFSEIPIIMLTSLKDKDVLESALAAGANDYVVKPFDETELRARVSSALRLKHEIDQRKLREQDLLDLSQALIERQINIEQALYQDALTGIYNRRGFVKMLQSAWVSAFAQHKALSLIMIEIDRLRQIKEERGQLSADRALKAVAELLPGHDAGLYSARFSEEAFVVLLPEQDYNSSGLIAEDLRASVEATELSGHDGQPLCLTLSLGVACVLPGESTSSSVLIAAADAALARSRTRGGNCVSG